MLDPVPRRSRTLTRATVLVVAIAALLTLCDWFCHVEQDVLSYRDPDVGSLLPGQPTLAVFLGFLGLSVLFVALSAWIFAGSGAPPRSRVAVSLVGFVALYFLTGVLRDHPMVIYSSYLLLWLLHLRFTGLDQRRLVTLSVLLAVAGPIAEGIRADSGFFAYADIDAFNVPMWLSALYLNGAITLAALTSTVLNGGRRRPLGRTV